MRISTFIAVAAMIIIAAAGCASRPLYFPTSQEEYNKAMSETAPPPTINDTKTDLAPLANLIIDLIGMAAK